MPLRIYKPNGDPQWHIRDRITVFLAGSIEMGSAEDWQAKLEEELSEYENLILFNPRRDKWDPTWQQKQSAKNFNYQVNWELNHLDLCDIIFMYFDPSTKSPISLLELGLYAKSEKLLVCCPDGFWRKGNVEVVCTRYNIPFFQSFDEAVGALKTKIIQRVDLQ